MDLVQVTLGLQLILEPTVAVVLQIRFFHIVAAVTPLASPEIAGFVCLLVGKTNMPCGGIVVLPQTLQVFEVELRLVLFRCTRHHCNAQEGYQEKFEI